MNDMYHLYALLKDEFNTFLHMININNSYPLKNNYNNICNLKM